MSQPDNGLQHPLPERFITDPGMSTGGRLKQRPDDFIVEEMPLYHAAGEGEHLYLHIEKVNRATLDVVRDIAEAFAVPHHLIGYAGMKDKHAVTRQWVSVHTRSDDAESRFRDVPGVRLLEARRHRNKLRLGHLRGNRFTIRLREVRGGDVIQAEATAREILGVLAHRGVPNFVGEQRFGFRMNNHEVGRLYLRQDWSGMCRLLLGGPDPVSPGDFQARLAFENGEYAKAAKQWPKSQRLEWTVLSELAAGASRQEAILAASNTMRRFLVSAFQSAVFNHVLARRIDEELFDCLVEGDLAIKHANLAVFTVGPAEAADETVHERCARLEISASGPMWGHDMVRTYGRPERIELECLRRTGVQIADFQTPPHDVRGLRRPLRQPVTEVSVGHGVDDHGPYVQVGFVLPRGAFATTVLREVMKWAPREHPWGTVDEE